MTSLLDLILVVAVRGRSSHEFTESGVCGVSGSPLLPSLPSSFLSS